MNVSTKPFATPVAGSKALFRNLVLGAILLGALALRLYRLGAQSLWLDEGGTWIEATRNGWPQLIADMFRPTAAYPLYHLLLKFWIAFAGDSEWALRFPSALAGAAMVAVLVAAAHTQRAGAKATLLVGLLAATSPYALWHAQDAKAYSLLMLVVALLLWAALRALRPSLKFKIQNSESKTQSTIRFEWLLLGGLVVVSLFVHRLALLSVAAVLLALGLIRARRNGQRTTGNKRSSFVLHPASFALLALAAASLGVLGLARSTSSNGWQESGHSAARPLESLWLNLQHFILDRGDIAGFWNVPVLVWMLPALLLTLWGLVLLIRDILRGNQQSLLVLSMLVVPLLLFAVALAFTPVYEARYAAVAFPAWVLVMARPFADERRTTNDESKTGSSFAVRLSSVVSAAFVAATLVANAVVLLQPEHGLFSGAPVKEEWRKAIHRVAYEVHPDDLLVLHPYYTLPLWEYYAPRVTPDPLPRPEVFPIFGEGNCVETYRGRPQEIRECFKRTYDDKFNEKAYGKKRALLLIAPDHAATIDPPKTLADLQADYNAGIWPNDAPEPTKADQFGWLGLRFLYKQNTWPCGGDTFVGLQTMCQSYPSVYNAGGAGKEPMPAISLNAVFGGEIKLRGYSLNLLGGKARPGGALPITLYWEAAIKPTRNYSMFLHVCRDCEQPPLAGVDGPPLRRYDPAGLTSTWIVGDPVHDERSIALPSSLTPGRYTLILGVRPADEDPNDLTLRLPVQATQAETLGTSRLVLGTIEVSR